jgi:hypothetical protein
LHSAVTVQIPALSREQTCEGGFIVIVGAESSRVADPAVRDELIAQFCYAEWIGKRGLSVTPHDLYEFNIQAIKVIHHATSE